MEMAAYLGIELLAKEEFCWLQQRGEFDIKSSRWVTAPADIRKLGGGLFGDRRYARVFIDHHGARLYYSRGGFRSSLRD